LTVERRSLSFVIPVRNDAAQLGRCLAAIRRATPPDVDVDIIVADNGSTDDSVAAARAANATVLLLPGVRLGELRNLAAGTARGDVLAFVDADNEIVSGWITAALEALASDRHGAAGAPYRAPSPATWVQHLYDRLRRHPTRQEPVDWLGSGNMAIRRDAFVAVGGFDSTLETCEDVDLCRKLRAHGYVILASDRLGNVHYGDPRTLRQVFFGELWRGRDNVRVSLRRPLAGRTVLTAIVPLASLAAALVVLAGLLAGTDTGFRTSAAALLFLVGLVVLRAALMVRSAFTREWPAACAVAAAYEAGRALALAGRFGYRHRRDTGSAG
jgi:hypothetical protein